MSEYNPVSIICFIWFAVHEITSLEKENESGRISPEIMFFMEGDACRPR